MIHKLQDTCGCIVMVDVICGVLHLTAIGRCRRHRGRIYRDGDVSHYGGDTAEAAARRLKGHLRKTDRKLLYTLRSFPRGLTVEEVTEKAKLHRLTAGSRLTVLSRCEQPLVRDTGERRAHKSTGNIVTVWGITQHGREIIVAGEQLMLGAVMGGGK